MKLTNWLISKIGSDKLLHFLGGAWITSIPSVFGWFGILIGVILTILLSIVKELIDTTFDWKDICAAMIGSTTSTIIYLILFLML